eukprot:726426-Amphidinium_carterae.1
MQDRAPCRTRPRAKKKLTCFGVANHQSGEEPPKTSGKNGVLGGKAVPKNVFFQQLLHDSRSPPKIGQKKVFLKL